MEMPSCVIEFSMSNIYSKVCIFLLAYLLAYNHSLTESERRSGLNLKCIRVHKYKRMLMKN